MSEDVYVHASMRRGKYVNTYQCYQSTMTVVINGYMLVDVYSATMRGTTYVDDHETAPFSMKGAVMSMSLYGCAM